MGAAVLVKDVGGRVLFVRRVVRGLRDIDFGLGFR